MGDVCTIQLLTICSHLQLYLILNKNIDKDIFQDKESVTEYKVYTRWVPHLVNVGYKDSTPCKCGGCGGDIIPNSNLGGLSEIIPNFDLGGQGDIIPNFDLGGQIDIIPNFNLGGLSHIIPNSD